MTDASRFSDDEIELGRKLFAGPCDFMRGVAGLEGLPPADLPEIAFAGRSNVGKSSLLNALTGRKGIARVSDTPGRTREINFFSLGGRLILVDLPGYGYARVSASQIKAWNRTVRDYLRGRPTLKRVLVLIDSRHGIKESDEDVMQLLGESAVSFQVVLTKADAPKAAELQSIVAKTSARVAKRVAAHPIVHVTSAERGDGVPELRTDLAQLAQTPVSGL
jgi:GTP-binding protein